MLESVTFGVAYILKRKKRKKKRKSLEACCCDLKLLP
jgi:hypothetical protein